MTPMAYRAGAYAALVLVVLSATPASAEDAAAKIKATLEQWTEDFNAGRKDKVCALFTRDARADVAGAPERDYHAICDLLTKSLSDKARRYHYDMVIKEILVFGDIAVVRLVWTLTIKKKTAVWPSRSSRGWTSSRSNPMVAGRSSVTWLMSANRRVPLRPSPGACPSRAATSFPR